MPPYNGRPFETMVSLMNSFRMKPGYIVWGGYLHVWVNILYWMRESRDLDFRHTVGAVSAVEELELFRAYKAYYDQLRREVPAPYAAQWHGRTSATRVSRCRVTRAARTTSSREVCAVPARHPSNKTMWHMVRVTEYRGWQETDREG